MVSFGTKRVMWSDLAIGSLIMTNSRGGGDSYLLVASSSIMTRNWVQRHGNERTAEEKSGFFNLPRSTFLIISIVGSWTNVSRINQLAVMWSFFHSIYHQILYSWMISADKRGREMGDLSYFYERTRKDLMRHWRIIDTIQVRPVFDLLGWNFLILVGVGLTKTFGMASSS